MNKLTFAISCYNFEKYIEQCILSILNQRTNFDFDIVIRDDKSTDNSCEVIENIITNYSHLRKIRLIRSDNNVGVNENVRLLLSECEGQYIALLDGDDYLTDNNKLHHQVDFLDNNPEYVLHSTSYKYIDKDSNIIPADPDKWLCPIKQNVELKDLLDRNLISFGRVFRNLKSIHEGLRSDYYKNFPYDDWALNFEILKNGKAMCEDWPTGIYRITGTGVISSDSEEKVNEKNKKCKDILNQEYSKLFDKSDKNFKIITIVDSFVHNQKVETKLIECIDRLKKYNHEILLISNTQIKPEIQNKVEYFIYDKRNQLFSNNTYSGIRDIDIFRSNDIYESHEIKEGLQKHGLSVLINIFNSLELAKSLGYTHFFRFEVDDEFGQDSLNYINTVPKTVIDQNKVGLFYFNEGAFHNGVNDTEPNNVSFHFMFSEIEFFLNNIPKIKCEQDYKDYLLRTKNNLDFEIAEEFLYNNLIKCDQNLFIKKGGLVEMEVDFPDTNWNQIVSESNTSEKFRGCTTMIYQVRKYPEGVSSIMNPYHGEETDQISILSYNSRDRFVDRKIEVVFRDGNKTQINHTLPVNGAWCYNNFDKSVDKILVYENDEFLYEDKTDTTKNYIKFK